jgi:ATP-dependent Clp protease ATP-binding subunit ClpC
MIINPLRLWSGISDILGTEGGSTLLGMRRFTNEARNALNLAHKETVQMRQHMIGSEQLLLALLQEQDGTAGKVLRKLGLEPEHTLRIIEDIVGQGKNESGKIELSSAGQRVLELALRESMQMGCEEIGTDHLLLALMHSQGDHAQEILERLGILPEEVRRLTLQLMKDTGKPA